MPTRTTCLGFGSALWIERVSRHRLDSQKSLRLGHRIADRQVDPRCVTRNGRSDNEAVDDARPTFLFYLHAHRAAFDRRRFDARRLRQKTIDDRGNDDHSQCNNSDLFLVELAHLFSCFKNRNQVQTEQPSADNQSGKNCGHDHDRCRKSVGVPREDKRIADDIGLYRFRDHQAQPPSDPEADGNCNKRQQREFTLFPYRSERSVGKECTSEPTARRPRCARVGGLKAEGRTTKPSAGGGPSSNRATAGACAASSSWRAATTAWCSIETILLGIDRPQAVRSVYPRH